MARSVLFGKLRALYPHEPVIDLLEAWVRAPVIFDGRRIERRRGLPQDSSSFAPLRGNPVSPLLATLCLDTFAEALLDRDFRLVRFADDFVVLARDLEEVLNAAFVTVWHTHPELDPRPSRRDRDWTYEIQCCGRHLRIPVLESIVLGGEGRFAFVG